MNKPSTNSDFNLKERIDRLSERSVEDALLDTVGGALINYINGKNQEIEKCKNALEEEKRKNEFLMEYLRQNNIPVPDFTNGIPTTIPKVRRKNGLRFRDLIQVENKDSVLKRLHELIDGKKCKDVACVIMKALEDKLISRRPTEKEFKEEFTDVNLKWGSIECFFRPSYSPKPDYSKVIIMK